MAEQSVRKRLAAILAADVVGFSRLMEADEIGTLTRLKTIRRELFEPATRQRGGRIFKTTGDGALVEFKSAADAVGAAVAVQSALAERERDEPEGRRIALRIGVSLGDVMVEGGDLYGNGVNVAARMEGLAETGGICISGNVHEQVRSTPGLVFDDLGEQAVKNIERPVRAYRVASAGPVSQGPEGSETASPVPSDRKPSIAILPFSNLSGDPEQEFFADGLTEDTIAGLSRIHSFQVAGRNSTLQYKGKDIDARAVARELKVNYVLEGSVRKAGNRIRVSVQLSDGVGGRHLWSERYDRELDDIFAVQDEITGKIVAHLWPELGHAEYERTKSRPPENLESWELFHRGMALSWRRTDEAAATARDYFERSLKRDPLFAQAYVGLAASYLARAAAMTEADRRRVLDWSRRAVELDGRDPLARFALGLSLRFVGDFGAATREFEASLQLNPSNPFGHFGLATVLLHRGDAHRALAHIEQAVQLCPSTDPNLRIMLTWLGMAYLCLGRYEDAVDAIARSAPFVTNWPRWVGLASAFGHLGRGAEARHALEELEKERPGVTIAALRQPSPSLPQPFIDLILDGLRKAGLPE